MTSGIRFTTAGVRHGFVTALPISFAISVFAMVFGLIAGQKGLSLAEVLLMSMFVFAGASQMLALELWAQPVPVLSLALAAFIINLRFMMMTAALRPWLGQAPPVLAYSSVHLTADENWALSITEMRRGGLDAGFHLGSGLSLWVFWVVFSALGRLFGGLVAEPERFGLDFVPVAVFLALVVPLFEGRSSLLPWAGAAAASALAAWLLPGAWFLVIGGLTGSLLGAWRDVS